MIATQVVLCIQYKTRWLRDKLSDLNNSDFVILYRVSAVLLLSHFLVAPNASKYPESHQ